MPDWTHVTRRYLTVLVGLLLLITGCVGGGVADVTLAQLAADQDFHAGRSVRTQGLVQAFGDPPHVWIEDGVPNRVEIIPAEAVADLVGQQVRVEGRFTYAEDEGRRITVDTVEVVDPSG